LSLLGRLHRQHLRAGPAGRRLLRPRTVRHPEHELAVQPRVRVHGWLHQEYHVGPRDAEGKCDVTHSNRQLGYQYACANATPGTSSGGTSRRRAAYVNPRPPAAAARSGTWLWASTVQAVGDQALQADEENAALLTREFSSGCAPASEPPVGGATASLVSPASHGVTCAAPLQVGGAPVVPVASRCCHQSLNQPYRHREGADTASGAGKTNQHANC